MEMWRGALGTSPATLEWAAFGIVVRPALQDQVQHRAADTGLCQQAHCAAGLRVLPAVPATADEEGGVHADDQDDQPAAVANVQTAERHPEATVQCCYQSAHREDQLAVLEESTDAAFGGVPVRAAQPAQDPGQVHGAVERPRGRHRGLGKGTAGDPDVLPTVQDLAVFELSFERANHHEAAGDALSVVNDAKQRRAQREDDRDPAARPTHSAVDQARLGLRQRYLLCEV